MRTSSLVACGAVVLAAAAACAACAASENNAETMRPLDSGDTETVIPDAGAAEANVGAEASVEPMCSEAGWCATSLPDTDLAMKDIWPLPHQAFAIAESPTLGVKVLEWNDAVAEWRYIDDSTQNEPGFGAYSSKIWAPNENEVYYGVAPGYIYHGVRPPSPDVAWSWSRHRLRDTRHSDPREENPYYGGAPYPALGVWGTSSDDVYAWFTNTIYHLTSVDGGLPEWIAEYVADDPEGPDERLLIVGAAGITRDDVWFSGTRSLVLGPDRVSAAACALVMRKTAVGYRRIVDGIVPAEYGAACTERGGALMIGGAEGWLTDIQALAPQHFIGLKGDRDVVRITVEGDSYSVYHSPVPDKFVPYFITSLWSSSEGVWLTGDGRVARGTDIWDGGAYRLSTIALTGAPLNRAMYQIRGTSNTNLWAIGVQYALHKTTP